MSYSTDLTDEQWALGDPELASGTNVRRSERSRGSSEVVCTRDPRELVDQTRGPVRRGPRRRRAGALPSRCGREPPDLDLAVVACCPGDRGVSAIPEAGAEVRRRWSVRRGDVDRR